MHNHELLGLAAKAAGIEVHGFNHIGYVITRGPDNHPVGWNPLTDDEDTLRMAVKLGIVIDSRRGVAYCSNGHFEARVPHGSDAYTATRRAVTMVAVQVGEAMP